MTVRAIFDRFYVAPVRDQGALIFPVYGRAPMSSFITAKTLPAPAAKENLF